jgi:hypothetical protein
MKQFEPFAMWQTFLDGFFFFKFRKLTDQIFISTQSSRKLLTTLYLQQNFVFLLNLSLHDLGTNILRPSSKQLMNSSL